MRRLLLVITVTLTQYCFAQSAQINDSAFNQATPIYNSSWYTYNFISFKEAQNIIKQPFYIKDSVWKYSNNGYLRYSFIYETNTADSITKRTASLFFSMEQYKTPVEAKEIYDVIKKNQNSIGEVSNLNEIENEGILRIDKFNNPFIMIRKGNKLYKLSTRFTPEQKSNDELILLAKKIVSEH